MTTDTIPPTETPATGCVRRVLHNLLTDTLAAVALGLVLFLLMFGPK